MQSKQLNVAPTNNCAVLCCAVLCCAALCCAVLRCALLCCAYTIKYRKVTAAGSLRFNLQ